MHILLILFTFWVIFCPDDFVALCREAARPLGWAVAFLAAVAWLG